MFRNSSIHVLLSLSLKTPLFLALAGLVLPVLPSESAYADPPPWAPAHGYRNKHKGHHDEDEDKDQYVREEVPPVPYDIDRGTCNRQLLGQVLGGAAGAVVGSTVGKGTGKTAAIVGGAIVGVLIGGKIGRQMDEVDHHCVGQILEHAEEGKRVAWSNPNNNVRYEVTPLRTFEAADGRYCRKFSTDAFYGDQKQRTNGIACRQPDGAWAVSR